MTYQEVIDDAKADVGAYGSFPALTNNNLLAYVSEAIHEIQNETHVIKSTVTVLTSALDANGTAPLPLGITVPTRCVYTPSGGTLIGSQQVTTVGPDVLANWKSLPTYASNTLIPYNTLYVSLEQNRLVFWPFQGLNGTFTFTAYAKMPIFTNSRAADPNSYWYQWDVAHGLATKMATTLIPQELEVAERGIVSYVSARLLQSIPGWKRLFKEDYMERMMRYRESFDKVEKDQPNYPVNYSPTPNYGW